VALPHPRTSQPLVTRWLESERLLATLLLAPTVIMLGVFIAYPFVMGVWLSLSSTSVGNRQGAMYRLGNSRERTSHVMLPSADQTISETRCPITRKVV